MRLSVPRKMIITIDFDECRWLPVGTDRFNPIHASGPHSLWALRRISTQHTGEPYAMQRC